MFVILEGSGTLRVADERIAVRQGDVIDIPAGPEYPPSVDQHIECAAQVFVDQHAGVSRSLRIPGLGQMPGIRPSLVHLLRKGPYTAQPTSTTGTANLQFRTCAWLASQTSRSTGTPIRSLV